MSESAKESGRYQDFFAAIYSALSASADDGIGPVYRLDVRAKDVRVLGRLVMGKIVRKVAGVPDHYVGLINPFTVHPLVDPGLIWWANRLNAIVDLGSAVFQEPHVSSSKGSVRGLACDPVIRAWPYFDGGSLGNVTDFPSTLSGWVTPTPGLEQLPTPVRSPGKRRLVVLLNAIATCVDDIEI